MEAEEAVKPDKSNKSLLKQPRIRRQPMSVYAQGLGQRIGGSGTGKGRGMRGGHRTS